MIRMQFTVQVQAMIDGLNIVTRALAARSAREILNGVLVEADSDGILLTCSDGSLTIQTAVEGEVKEAGRTVLPARIFFELVRKLPGGDMQVKIADNGRATIQCLSSRSTLTAMDPMEYPEMSDEAQGTEVKIGQAQLKKMINGVVFAIATDENRQLLTGILMEVNSGEARLVALDGFRLALQVDQRAFDADGLRVVIPGRVMQELGRVLPEEEEDCSLVFGGGHMTATFGKTRLETVLLAGEYIDYKRILPASFATETLVNRSDIQNAIDRASLMAREGKNNLIRMSVNEGTMTISSNAELGDVREELTVATNGNPIEIAFNAKYLTDVIRNVGDDELCMKFNSNVSPCVIVPKEGNAYLFLVLPVRIF